MRQPIEYQVLQNPVLGAAAITQAVIEYHKAKKEGMPLPLVMAVLPMVFHKKTAEVVARMHKVGAGLPRAIDQDRTLRVGLQQRMEGMGGLSFRALNLALSCKRCVALDFGEDVAVVPCRKTIQGTDMGYEDGDATDILKAASRVGYWLGSYEVAAVCRQLDLRF